MKLHVLSDLHTEGRPFDLPDTDADVIILAGDITTWAKHGIGPVELWALKKPIVYVGGNHEYYRGWFKESLEFALESASATDNVHLLENREADIGNIRFLGCTLWTNFDLYNDIPRAMEVAEEWMNDYAVINCRKGLLMPEDTRFEHEQSVTWLRKELDKPFAGKTVVVTHHAPSAKSITERFIGEPTNPAFVSDLEYLMPRVDLWVHGHTHSAQSYYIGKTRVICNPRGYRSEKTGFNPELVIEV